MTELVQSVRLKYDGSGIVGQVKATKAEVQELGAAAKAVGPASAGIREAGEAAKVAAIGATAARGSFLQFGAAGGSAAADIARLNGELAEARGGTSSLAADVAKLTRELNQGQQSLAGATSRIDILETRLKQQRSSTRSAADDTNRHAFAVRNLGQQFGDLGLSIAGGISPARAFGQQAGQMGYAMSELGGKAGKVGAFLTGPWGIALTVGAAVIAPLIENLLSADDASDTLAKSQEALAGYLDRTTGKVREQIGALALLSRAETLRGDKAAAVTAYQGKRSALDRQFFAATTPTLIPAGDASVTLPALLQGQSADKVRALFAEYRKGADAGGISIQQLVGNLRKLGEADPSIREFAKTVLTTGTQIEAAARKGGGLTLELARIAVASGTATAEQKRLVTANTEQTKSTTGLIEKQVALATATNALEKARAQYNLVLTRGPDAEKAGGAAAAQYRADLTAASQAVKAAEAANDNARTATRAHKAELREAASAAREFARENDALAASLRRTLDAINGIKLVDFSGTLGTPLESLLPGRFPTGRDAVAEKDRLREEADNRTERETQYGIDARANADLVGDAVHSALEGDFRSVVGSLGDLGAIFDLNLGKDSLLGRSFSSILKNGGIGGAVAGITGGSKLGGSIGGAIGGELGKEFLTKGLTSIASSLGPLAGPIGAIAGGVLGSVVGGLFSKTPSGKVTLSSATGDLAATGNDGASKKAALSLGGSIQDALKSIADQFGGSLGAFNVTVGQRHGDYRVTTGSSLKVKSGAKDFDGDGDAAASYALSLAIGQGAVAGLSAAVSKALGSSTDVSKAVAEALQVQKVENIVADLGSDLVGQFRSFEAEAGKRVQIAQQYGLDVLKIETYNAGQRKKLVDDTLKAQVGSLTSFLGSLNTGSLFEGDAATRRGRLLANISGSQTDVAAGKDGAADTLAGYLSQLVETTKAAYGTGGAEYAADRRYAQSVAEQTIKAESDRVAAAQAATRKTNEALDRGNALTEAGNTLLDEANAQAARMIAQGAEMIERLGQVATAVSGLSKPSGVMSNLRVTPL